MHGHQNHGRDNIYRDFRRKQEAASGTQAQDTAVALEPEDESARALYRMGRRGMFMGSPEYIRENVRAYERAHVDVLLFLSQCGDRRHEDIMESLELFAREVMPEFKERHGSHQRWREEQLDGVAHPVGSSV
jgi:alkanesulfonate monooxygenase SsuD/methylene tetrahydromethanopterin reductase-like flavin-dependent oxidoreductase (luciferase family)